MPVAINEGENAVKIQKPYTNQQYAELAVYCNQNDYHIEDKGSYLEAVKNKGPTKQEIQSEVRSIRNRYLDTTDKFMVSDYPITEEQQAQYKAYRKYLRDYTSSKNWWKTEPLSFNNWSQNAG